MKTDVLFVYPKYPDGEREVLALFPKEFHNKELYGKELIVCYARIGQHSCASRSFLRRKRATKEQYKSLATELRSIGYKLNILN
jgi:hypothetical protein